MLRAGDVIRLHMGHFTAPAHLPFAGTAVVVSAFLIRHPRGPVLLDTGIGVGLPEVEERYKPVRTGLDAVLRAAGASVAGQAFQDAAAYARDMYAWRLDREGAAHPAYAPWVARLQEFDPWRVTFAHDLAVWQRSA